MPHPFLLPPLPHRPCLLSHPPPLPLPSSSDGLIVSNHGGRQLDGTPSALEALPAIVDAVGGRVPVLIDGGIRRGTDVVKAMACGAAGVGIGRPVLYGLAAGGEEGVTSVLDILTGERESLSPSPSPSPCPFDLPTDEITRCLGMLGVARPADVAGAGVVVQRQSVAPRPVVARR